MSENFCPPAVSAVTWWSYGDTVKSPAGRLRPAEWAEPVATLAVTRVRNSAPWPSCCVWSLPSSPSGVFERASNGLAARPACRSARPTFLHLEGERKKKSLQADSGGGGCCTSCSCDFERRKHLHLLSGTGLATSCDCGDKQWLCPAADPPPPPPSASESAFARIRRCFIALR